MPWGGQKEKKYFTYAYAIPLSTGRHNLFLLKNKCDANKIIEKLEHKKIKKIKIIHISTTQREPLLKFGGVLFFFLLGVKLELQLSAYTTATAARDPSHVCHNAGSFNPMSTARDQTHMHMDTSQVHYH